MNLLYSSLLFAEWRLRSCTLLRSIQCSLSPCKLNLSLEEPPPRSRRELAALGSLVRAGRATLPWGDHAEASALVHHADGTRRRSASSTSSLSRCWSPHAAFAAATERLCAGTLSTKDAHHLFDQLQLALLYFPFD
jgi:hypothetical protein